MLGLWKSSPVKFGIRPLFTGFGICVFVLVLILTVALSWGTTIMHQEARMLRESLETVVVHQSSEIRSLKEELNRPSEGRRDAKINNLMTKADLAIEASAKMDRYGDYVAYSCFGLFLFFLVFILFGANGWIYKPLKSVHAAISAFSKGRLQSRAPEVGVTELAYIATAFNTLADHLVAMNDKRAQFLAGTAHDLRNPLSALKMNLQLMQHDSDNLSERQKAKLAIMSRQVTRLENLTSSFLDAVRVDSGQFELRPQRVELSKLLRDSVELWESTSEKHRIVADLPESPLELECDPVRIEQVITNLLSNAIKYSPDGGSVEVSLLATAGGASIRVKDEGIGIPTDEIGKIFEPFHRSAAAQSVSPGVGIGLWISKKLVEAHSGSLEVESQPGRGTTFTIHLPRRTADRSNESSMKVESRAGLPKQGSLDTPPAMQKGSG